MCLLFLHSFIPIFSGFCFFLEKEGYGESCNAELWGSCWGCWKICPNFFFLILVKGMKLCFQIQNIKQTNSALKEKLEGGIEQYRLPEVGSFSDLCLLWT